VSQTCANEVNLEDVSVCGTGAGFRGSAKPAGTSFVDASWEYSLTRSWVLAVDVTYRHNGNTRVIGNNILDPNSARNPPVVRRESGSSEAFGFAPAVEYSWKPNLSLLVGTRVITVGGNAAHTITPAVAINFVH
jgi:hypothetical protein